ncbi:CRAL/TRIO domain-containing protein [Violaceomyces palustris]|uniref:CRAL/TRIO domain-containing protein n=1 Tax=Violaceomyces palustris TaxID=1673888 RepID=A0ACD0P408_9BASI|nr:CRAL/TRIO domain-containing protein [Violaceomyces palustris]
MTAPPPPTKDLSQQSSRSSSNQPRPSPTTNSSSSFFGRASSMIRSSRAPNLDAPSAAHPHHHPHTKAAALKLSHQTTKSSLSSVATKQSTHLYAYEGVFPQPDPSVRPERPQPLSDVQEAKYQQVLAHFKSVQDYPLDFKAQASRRQPLSDWEKSRMLTRESMLRYLRATKWDVEAAQRRLTDTIIWRREYGVDSLNPDDLEPEARSGKETVLGFDKRGRPLHYMHPHRNDTQESPRQMQFAVWILEKAIDLMPPGVEQLALLINFASKSRNPTSISNAKLMLYILQNHYVERLGIALCINVPWIFKAFWSAIQPFIDPVTKSKCKFDEAIRQEVPPQQLSSDFGGDLDFQYDHDSYWPDLIRLCNQRREEQLRRFIEVCKGEIGASEWVIRGGDEEPAASSSTSSSSPPPQPVTANANSKTTSHENPPNSNTTTKKDSGYEEASVVEAQSKLVGGQSPAVVGYQPTPEEGEEQAEEQEIERFVTSSEELSGEPIERQFTRLSTKASSAALDGTKEEEEEEEDTGVETTTTNTLNDASIGSPKRSISDCDGFASQPRVAQVV